MIGVLDIILIVLFAVVAPLFVYLAAKRQGHKPVYWALVALAVGVLLQFVLPAIVGVIAAVALVSAGNSPNAVAPPIQSYSLLINISCSILNVVAILIVLRRVRRNPAAEIAAPDAS